MAGFQFFQYNSPMKICIAQFEGIDNTPALPLAAGQLIASARSNVSIKEKIDFDIIVPRVHFADLHSQFNDSALAAFSIYPWNAQYSLQAIKGLQQSVPIIVGGPSIPKRKDAIIAFMKEHRQVDFMLLGEGEENFTAFLLCLMGDQQYERVPSYSIENI